MKYEGMTVRVCTAEIERDGRFLIARRPEGKTLPGLWEFPGGRARERESDEEALRRCLASRLGLEARVAERVLEVMHPYEGYTVQLVHYRVDIGDQEPSGNRVVAWVAPDEFGAYEFPAADQHTVESILASDSIEVSKTDLDP